MKLGSRKGVSKCVDHEGNIECKESSGKDGKRNRKEENST